MTIEDRGEYKDLNDFIEKTDEKEVIAHCKSELQKICRESPDKAEAAKKIATLLNIELD